MQGISEMISRMIDFYDGNLHDIDHFIKVWAYAKTIGELEHLDEETQFILETAAIVHDIACPLCREKYGNAGGKH
ncbi:MAG: phosphohydrolase, partial [Lachnospiraceae bacterium]|nr:phosphohydrolase [Lachnospiraceae bacterium]